MKAKRISIGQRFVRLGHFRTVFCVAILAMLLAPAARASDPIGVYAYIDRVVFEPSEAAPERVQVWGGFAVAQKSPGNMEYRDPERGYMYFKVTPGKEEVCKREWADLKSVAGTRQIVAFGARHQGPLPTVRKPDVKPENPDVYPIALGVTKVRMAQDYKPVRDLVAQQDEAVKAKEAPVTR